MVIKPAEKVKVSENDLSALAGARAPAAKQWLQSEGGADGERLFVVTGNADPQDGHDAEHGGAVELKLK